jgi:bifunctional non-homologous end joining protein LigD
VSTRFRFIEPCSPIPAVRVPSGPDWLHEVKFDGYRVQIHKVGSDVAIFSRNGHDFTSRFGDVAAWLRTVP